MKKCGNLLVLVAIIALLPGLCLPSEKTILFKLRYIEQPLQNISLVGNKKLGHAEVVGNLINSSTFSQADFIGALETSQKITDYEPLWIANIIKVTGDSSELAILAQRPDVEEVIDNFPVEPIEPVEGHENAITENGHESGLDAIRAPQAWALGLDGNGSLVCSFDTGVDGDHAALISKYRGNNGGASGACWFDPYSHTEYPTDNNGHGSHTMGIMVGSDSSDTVGVAPGAEWIAAGVISRGGGIQRTIADILAAFQWAADPDGDPSTTADVPDVVNNSWGIPQGYYPSCEATFWEAIDNLEAAGVVCIFAAGNEGPNYGTMRIPADRISSQFNAFSVGAVDGNSPDFTVAEFSSRGPSGCDHQTIKPEVCAPGVGVRSASRDGSYAILSGTSMAAPHVAGAVAILRQFNPQATPDQIKLALMNSVLDLGQPGEDNDYGWGMIDIRRAIDFMPIPENPFPAIVSTTISGDGLALPGEDFQLTISIMNLGGTGSNINAHLSVSDSRAQILSGDIIYNSLGHDDTSSAATWDIHFSSEFNLGEQVIFTLDLSMNGWAVRRHFIIPVSDLYTHVDDQITLPETLLILTNYPNPFNSSTMITLNRPAGVNSNVMIYDTCGRLIRKLTAIDNRAIWDGADSEGKPVAAGIYFAKAIGHNSPIRKMLLLK